MATKSTKKATSKKATKKTVTNKPLTTKKVVTSKNFEALAKEGVSLNELVWQAAPKMTNQEMVDALTAAGRKFTINSLRWYASKARAGVRR